MRTNYSKHISPAAPLEGLLADAEIDDLDPLGLPAVEDVLRLDIPVANIPVMQILDSFDQFLGHQFDLLLAADVDFSEAGLVEAFHDQVGAVLLEIQVESLVADDRRMSQFFQIDKIALKFEDMFLLELELLCGEESARLLVPAFVDACICALADLLQQVVFLEEGVEGSAEQLG